MRITKSQPASRASVRWLWAVALLLVFGAGWLVGNGGWHRHLADWMTRFWRAPRVVLQAWATRADIPTLYVDCKFANMQKLATQRARALEIGAHLAEAAEAVPARLTLDGKTVDVDMHLPEIEAAALTGTRWPLVVVLRDGKTLRDLSRFILWPAAETTYFSLTYRAALRARHLPTTASYYVHLTVNGTGWGMYLVEEIPSVASLQAQGFPAQSVIVAFDRRAYLEAQPLVPDGSFAYARIVVFRSDNDARDDSELAAIRADVVRLLHGVEQGIYAPSTLFDPQTLADFMALTMLWRGTPTLDWRSLYLLYDPATRRFTPIGSSALPGAVLALPEAFTADPAIRRAYAQALMAFGSPTFLATLQQGEDWRTDAAVSSAETLAEHQARMRAFVAPVRPLVATITELEGGWQLTFANVTPFPVEVLALDVGERVRLPLDPAWVLDADRARLLEAADGLILPAQTGDVARSVTVHVPLTALPAAAFRTPETVNVITRIWGLEAQIAVPVEW